MVDHALEPLVKQLTARTAAERGERLRVAGLPSHLVRAYLEEEIEEQFRAREAAIRGPSRPLKFWQTPAPITVEMRSALLQLKREKSRLRLQLLGPDPADLTEIDHPYPPEKRTAVRRLMEDYAEAGKELRIIGNRDNFLAAERAQRSAFESERSRELAELLTPDEMLEFPARYSEAAKYSKYYVSGMGATEGEFRLILEAQRAAEEAVRGTEKPVKEWFDLVNREDLRQQVDDYLKNRLSAERFADYKRANDFDFQMMARIAGRAGATLQAAKEAWEQRTVATVESRRIGDDRTLTDEQKGIALQNLAANTREQMEAYLTPAGTAAYLQSSAANWFVHIAEGWAVTVRDRGMEMSPVSAAAKAKAASRRPGRPP